jgi:hypothetical protein
MKTHHNSSTNVRYQNQQRTGKIFYVLKFLNEHYSKVKLVETRCSTNKKRFSQNHEFLTENDQYIETVLSVQSVPDPRDTAEIVLTFDV